MPKTKFQDVVFTLMMVIVMVYAMVCYNIAVDKGGMSNEVFLFALSELPIMGVIAFVVEFLFVGKLAQKITFKHFDVKQTNPFIITLMISGVTVAFMCPIMSFIASLLFNYTAPNEIISNFINICVHNFPMALCWQIFYAGPFVRFLFRIVFEKNNK